MKRWTGVALLVFAAACARDDEAFEPSSLDDVPVSRSTAHLAEAPKSSTRRVLRVCADPNNLPFSNQRQEGLENALAQIVAKDLDADVAYAWWAQRRGFVRNTLNAGLCDVVMGVPGRFDLVETTQPVYRSRYVFVRRADRAVRPFRSFDDPRLRELSIGVHVIGDDYANSPPLHALSRRGVTGNIVGFRLLDDYALDNPPARPIEAVARGAVDVALVWGPVGGYFAARQSPPLVVEPTDGEMDDGILPLAYDIALGVRRGNTALREELDSVLGRRRAEIAALLRAFHVPVIREVVR
jgi:mxaJ protein